MTTDRLAHRAARGFQLNQTLAPYHRICVIYWSGHRQVSALVAVHDLFAPCNPPLVRKKAYCKKLLQSDHRTASRGCRIAFSWLLSATPSSSVTLHWCSHAASHSFHNHASFGFPITHRIQSQNRPETSCKHRCTLLFSGC